MYTHKIVDGVRIDLTAEEIAEINSRPPIPTLASLAPPTPTKEQLLAQLNALSAQIQALE